MKTLNLATLSKYSPTIRNTSIVIVLFGIFLLSITWINLYYRIQDERELAIEGAFKDTANFARAFEEHTLRTIKSADQAALFLKYEYEKNGRSIDIPNYLQEGRLANQPFVLLSVIDEDGDLAVSSQTPFVPSNLNDREHFQVHKDHDLGQLFISKPILGRSSGKWSIQMSRRINHPDGSFNGVVVVSVDPFYFTEFYKQVNLGENSTITLVGRDGIVRARESSLSSDIGQDMSHSALMEHLALSEVGHYITTSKIDGIKRIHSYQALNDYPFVVSVGISEEEVFRELNTRINNYYWGAGIVTIAIVIFIVFLLIITTWQKQTADQLKKARNTLELEVEKRTQELFAANQELVAMNEEHLAMNEELQHTNQELQNEITDRIQIESMLQFSKEKLLQRNNDLIDALETIDETQKRLVQQEKLAGLGQLAAGVAHEINNPLGFVTGNIEALEQYFTVFADNLAKYQEFRAGINNLEDPDIKEKIAELIRYEKEKDLEYIISDLPELFGDTLEGLDRMSKIVKGMRVFCRIDPHQTFEEYDLIDGLESTLLIAHNEIKHCATVQKNLNSIPVIEAIRGEINQVLLNLIINAAQAIKSGDCEIAGIIKLSTWHDNDFVYCAIEDNGTGIPPENLNSIFNPFFTTKPVGQGTGMGLSISYDIIVNRHKGDISVETCEESGAKFTLKLPIRHND